MLEKINELRQVFQTIWPMAKNALISGQFFKPQCEITDPDEDILCQYDVEIPMSEGFSVTVNIYRSKSAAEQGIKVPVVMCAHPYDASLTPALKRTPFNGPPQQYRMVPQAGKPQFSSITSWEAPDPNFWVASGYAVVNMNMPGYASSGGPPSVFSKHQAKCYYEAIEWVAAQEWCTGKVGLNGVSYLAISQFAVAACEAYGGPPPALACICPWEGLTNQYHDIMCSGGVDEIGFPPFWWNTEVKTTLNTSIEEFVRSEGNTPMEMLDAHPLYDDYWKSKVPALENITVPMLVCGSFADQGLHTMGSFRAFQKASSKHKWIYTHRTGKWDSYYSDEVKNLTREFMDCFLKEDASKAFLNTPQVRVEVRKSRDEIHEVRYENQWPLPQTQYKKLYLDNASTQLQGRLNDSNEEMVYSGSGGSLRFTYTFDTDTEITGYMKLRLWVESRSANAKDDVPDDMVICTAVNKLDQQGRMQHFYGVVGNKCDGVSRGFCKVSRRELNKEESTEWNPVLTGTSEKKLKAGQVVPVDIALYPSSTFFAAGERLELIVSSDEIVKAPPFKKDLSCNRGNHVVHVGGQYDSYLLIPEIPNVIESVTSKELSPNVHACEVT